jgi:hypothetical protein
MHHVRRKFRTVPTAKEHPAIDCSALPAGNAALRARNAHREGNQRRPQRLRAGGAARGLELRIAALIGAGAYPAEREST